MPTSTKHLGSFTCRKSTTWDRRVYFLSDGSRAGDFFRPEKIRRLRPGLNPRTWVLEANTLDGEEAGCSETFVFLYKTTSLRVSQYMSLYYYSLSQGHESAALWFFILFCIFYLCCFHLPFIPVLILLLFCSSFCADPLLFKSIISYLLSS
jgi:hypothetical protein